MTSVAASIGVSIGAATVRTESAGPYEVHDRMGPVGKY